MSYYPSDGGPCLRCAGRYVLVAVVDRDRLYACRSCGDQTGYRPVAPGEPMPSERGVPARELTDDPADLPRLGLVDQVRAIREAGL